MAPYNYRLREVFLLSKKQAAGSAGQKSGPKQRLDIA
jgi:hypothetical protein